MVTTVDSGAGAQSLEARINRMHRRDRLGALAFVVALWCAVIFVFFRIWPEINIQAIRIILAVCGAGLLALNTAAILAMLHHYESDKHFIYSLDLLHLDEMRKQKRV
jgi:hypothetical protein